MQKLQIFLYGIFIFNITQLHPCNAPTSTFYECVVQQHKHLDEGFHVAQLKSSFYDFLTSELSSKSIYDENFSTTFENTIAQAEYSVLYPMKDTFLEIIRTTAQEELPVYENLQHPYFLYIKKYHSKFSRPWIKEWIDTQDSFGNGLLHKIVNTKFIKTKSYEPNYQCACLVHIIHTLIELNADVNIINNNGASPLHFVHNYEIIKTLLHNYAHPNTQDKQGLTPLHMASRNTKSDYCLTQLLLRCGANPNLCDKRGIIPIFEAVKFNNFLAVQAFLEAGIDVNTQDPNGLTPLHYAAKFNESNKITQLLINHNAIIDKQSFDKITPLYLAAQYNNQATVKALLKAGANITIFDRNPNIKIYKEIHDILQDARSKQSQFCTIS